MLNHCNAKCRAPEERYLYQESDAEYEEINILSPGGTDAGMASTRAHSWDSTLGPQWHPQLDSWDSTRGLIGAQLGFVGFDPRAHWGPQWGSTQ